jgi:hypothetical protein
LACPIVNTDAAQIYVRDRFTLELPPGGRFTIETNAAFSVPQLKNPGLELVAADILEALQQRGNMISRPRHGRSWKIIPCLCLLWLATAGLLLGGGLQSHAGEASAFHEHGAGNSSPVLSADDHAHVINGDLEIASKVDLVVHCGAKILTHSDSPIFQALGSAELIFPGNGHDWLAINPGSDPPPPRQPS